MRFALLAVVLLSLAGCNAPKQDKAEPVRIVPAATPTYDLNVVVTEETPSGAPMRAEVQVMALRSDGSLGPQDRRGTDVQGAAHFSFREPQTLLVRVVGPQGWTQEGGRIHVADAIAATDLTVSDRDVFIPLYKSRLVLTAQHGWSTVAATAKPDGSVEPAVTFAALALPEDLQAAYLGRLVDARVSARWMDTTDGRAGTIATGLAWDGDPWVVGAESSAAEVGQREALWDGDLPSDRPTDLAATHLQATLQTGTAIIGDLLFDLDVTLDFGGHVPKEIPPDDCHGLLATVC